MNKLAITVILLCIILVFIIDPTGFYTALFVIGSMGFLGLIEYIEEKQSIGYRWVYHKGSKMYIQYKYDKRTGQLLGRNYDIKR